MNGIDTIVVMVTYDKQLFTDFNLGLLRAGGGCITSCVSNFALAEMKLSKNKANILIIDVDHGIYNSATLKDLMSKYFLMIILTGSNNELAKHLVRDGINVYMPKPNMHLRSFFVGDIIRKIDGFTNSVKSISPKVMQQAVNENTKIVVIASSTGGTEALEKILKRLGADIPPILIVQHMPSGFTKFFADRLNNVCKMNISEAKNNDLVKMGCVYIAPADYHMTLVKSNQVLMVKTFVSSKINGVMPAADVLFDSVAPIMKANALGIILTGMGADGAKGLYKMHLNGATTIGQNKETCVVYGMPKVARDLGALDMELPIDDIAPAIMKYAGR